ncbi:hypothetical protein B0H15DRAFT_925112 [Mycena belliarum]|uniref:Uncharacterized protein n=1 Tax=Mycena belliarum TaxID=1033014 RepID=A0AAD6TU91_9AGAR|nr:hypothetical protein B0H15DRAFT_925112 [Mycena belliae]
MPKRIPTPEPGDDEPKYFTVVQPYPLNANWELPHDYITFGRWIAGCIGPEPFFALFYKPSARGQVLLEINRDYPHPERLLGEHRWSEFLKKPSVEEAGRVSQIFYCVYSTGRQAQKDGWKRINVADSWFKNWTPENPIIQHPYPPTSWCPLPAEDRTNKPMCRPLPVSVKPPPPVKAAPPPIVPGSATWVKQRDAPPPTNTPAALRGAWAATRGSGRTNASATTRNTKAKSIANSAAPWHTATAPRSNNIVAVASSPAAPGFPPGLALLQGEDGEHYPAVPPGILVDPGSGSSTSSAGAPIPTVSAAQYDHVRGVTEGFVSISLSPSQEAHLYGAGVEVSPDPSTYVAEWEKMPAPDVDALWGFKAQTENVVESLWGDEDDAEKKKKTEILCTVHGIICKKGICKEYSRLLREKERAEARKGSDGGKGKGGKGGTGGGGGWSNSGGGKKKKGGWNEDDSSSATGSEGRAAPKAVAGDSGNGWATVRR